MVIYYDVLLIDDESLLGMKNSERFRRLDQIITCREGCAELVSRTNIRTSRPSTALALRELFAQCISSRGEGLVLKPDEPYFDFDSTDPRYRCCNIKLKKEYVQGLGDIGDFAVIGASYDAAKAREYRLPNVKWTHFYIGCLENRHQARAKTEIPKFRVTNIVELTGPVLSAFWAHQRPISVPYEENTAIELDYSGSALAKKPTAIFPCPLVFDMRCFAFDKEPNTNFWSMRFPQVSKVHQDRSYMDTITFIELQELAEAATHVPEEEDSQEMCQWVKELEKRDGGKFRVDTSSQATTCSDVPSSPSSLVSEVTPRQSRRDLRTPPRSSAVEAVAASVGAKPTNPPASASSCHKRSAAEESGPRQSTKRRRRHSGPSSINLSQESTPKDHSLPRTRPREPLSQVDLNGTENSRVESSQRAPSTSSARTPSAQDDTGLPTEKAVASSPAAYYTASEMASSPPCRSTRTRRNSTTTRNPDQANTSTSLSCATAQHECVLASCSILLSPCISSYAWVTDDLLRRHGIADPLLDPRVWNNADLQAGALGSAGSSESESTTPTPTSTDTETGGSSRRQQRRRLRKICLVEPKRKEATKAFLRKIKDADLKTKSGEREWVTVYDWRVLEFITEQEGRDKTSRVADPWRRFYVGIT